jgi:uncharacterized protein with FMN-binding domain
MEQSNRKQVLVTVAIIAVLLLVVIGTLLLTKKKAQKSLDTTTTTTESNTNPPATPSPSTSANTTNTATFKDGTYKATGSYTSPGGNESITISVTLKDGVVTDTSATSGANDPTAKQYQNEFIAGYKDQVVGKKINAIKLSRVSGSSLTSQGFNSAIQQIEQQAQA